MPNPWVSLRYVLLIPVNKAVKQERAVGIRAGGGGEKERQKYLSMIIRLPFQEHSMKIRQTLWAFQPTEEASESGQRATIDALSSDEED
jgi:hypothetical protein